MEKRYQVFISSTFIDLKDERQAILRAVLELGHMPAGMELFPASDDSAWKLIRDVIDASDYYALIVGGRYGSTNAQGLSFTEKEYNYAVSSKKRVVAFLHQNPDQLPRDRTETDRRAWARLGAFRRKVEKKHVCVYWLGAEDLKTKFIVSLSAEFKRHAALGWVRAPNDIRNAPLAWMLDSTKIPMYLTDNKLRIQHLNLAMSSLTGIPQDVAIGKHARYLVTKVSTFVPEALRPAFMKIQNRKMKGNRLAIQESEIVTLIDRSSLTADDGEKKYELWIRGYIVFDPDHEKIGVVAVYRPYFLSDEKFQRRLSEIKNGSQ